MQSNANRDVSVDWDEVYVNRKKHYDTTRELGKYIKQALKMLTPTYKRFTTLGKLTVLQCKQHSYLSCNEIYKCYCDCGQLMYVSLSRLQQMQQNSMCTTCQSLKANKVRVVDE